MLIIKPIAFGPGVWKVSQYYVGQVRLGKRPDNRNALSGRVLILGRRFSTAGVTKVGRIARRSYRVRTSQLSNIGSRYVLRAYGYLSR